MEQVNIIIIFLLITVLLFYLAFKLYKIMVRRAMIKVIKAFRDKGALGINSAREIDELGVTKRPFFTILRDYRPLALQYLIEARVIHLTNEGRMYLIEDKLPIFGLDDIK